MKKELKIGLIVIILGILCIIPIIYIVSNNIKSSVVLQLIEYDAKDNSTKIKKQLKVQVDDVIKLEEYDGNDIKILEINKDNVKISRDAVRYEIISQTSPYSGDTKKYIETVVENIDYEDENSINIDSSEPFGPAYEQPRFYYAFKFIKG